MSQPLFVLTFELAGKPCVISAFESVRNAGPNHARLDVEVKHGDVEVFPLGSLWCGVASQHSTDGTDARELVLSLVAMNPGDTDRDYFESYSPDQLDWAVAHGEGVDVVKCERYYGEDGNRLDRDACPGFLTVDMDDGAFCQICGGHESEHTGD